MAEETLTKIPWVISFLSKNFDVKWANIPSLIKSFNLIRKTCLINKFII